MCYLCLRNIPTNVNLFMNINQCLCPLHYLTICLDYKRAIRVGVCRPCVETELTATKKSATDGD